MTRTSYILLKDKARVEFSAAGEMFHFACCDCGLVHDIAVALEDNGRIGIAFRRNRTRTRDRRKEMKRG